MAHIERLESECPPDAHKVIRPPENEVNATIVVKVEESEEQKYGIEDLCSVLALMSDKPLLYCNESLKAKIEGQKAAEEIEPRYLQICADTQGDSNPAQGEAFIRYSDDSQGPAQPYIDLTQNPEECKNFLELLQKKQFLIIDTTAMLILRSISTVFPWDRLLAGDFMRQYERARDLLSAADLDLLQDIRYGRKDGYSIKETDPNAYQYLRLERKLFLQYPTEDDD